MFHLSDGRLHYMKKYWHPDELEYDEKEMGVFRTTAEKTSSRSSILSYRSAVGEPNDLL